MTSLKKLIASPGIRQSALMSGGNMVATGISAISIILLGRFMGPVAFGAFSIGFALSMLTTKIFDFGLNMSLQKYISQAANKDPLQIKQLITYTVKIKTWGSLAIILAAVILNPLLSPLLHLPAQSYLVFWGIALGLVVYWFDFIGYLLQGLSRFFETAVLAITQALSKVIVIVSLILFTPLSAVTTYIGYGLAPITGLILGIKLLESSLVRAPGLSITIRQKLWGMTKFTAVLSISAALTDYLDILLVQNLTNQYQTGLFSAASRITLLLSVVAISVNSVLNTRVAKYREPRLMRQYLKKAWALSVICCLAVVLVIPLSKIFLFVTAGPAYYDAGPALNYLLASGMIMLATAPLAAVFYGIEFPLYFALSGLTQVITLVIANLYLIPLFGITGAGMARLIMRLFVFGLTIIVISLVTRKTHEKNIIV